ncbi:MAG: phosphate signaling complex protein PhoU [Firmicutes bacterium]|jgi:phosphate transport system protein|nr:phosphate signaling complex protein PhoU [Bacillota bacterium]
MTRATFESELEELKRDILKMGTMVEQAIHDAVKSLADRDPQLAEKVVHEDDIADKLQLEIENKCLTLLALQQPIARDLRIIGTAMKIVTDLERMGDHAVDIARVTIRIHNQPLIKPLIDIPRMAQITKSMVKSALTAYVSGDTEEARKLAEADHEVDHLYNQVFRELLVYMMEDPRTISQATHLLFVASHLERIGDHATNLGEWIVYAVTGKREDLNR